MDLIKGVVSAISAKEIPEDRFGNTYRLSIKVGDDWIGLGSGKKPDIGVKEGDSWHTLSKGDEVALVVEENNGYLNGQKKTLKVTKKGSGSVSSSSKSDSSRGAVAAKPAPANSGVDWAAKDAGAAASASIDKAIAYFALNGPRSVTNDDILSKAREMQGLVKTLANEIMGKVPVEEKDNETPRPMTSGMPGKTIQNRTTKAKPAPVEPDPEDMEDDDIPF